MKVMVFDVGGTEIKYSVMDEQMNRFDAGSVPTPQDTQEHFLDTIYALYAPHKDEVDGIAMALPGFVDANTGYVSNGGALLYNTGTQVGQLVRERCGCRVTLENDGKAAAIAELRAGALQGCCNAAVFIIGTGVGGGIIANGQLVRGVHFTAGEYSFVNTNAEAWDAPDQNPPVSIHIKQGYQLLDGDDFVNAMRFRISNDGSNTYVGGDIERIQFQQKLLMALARQTLSLENIPNLTKIFEIYEKRVDTNVTISNLAYFATEFMKIDANNITFQTIPGKGDGYVFGMSYVIPYIDEWLEMVNGYLNPFTVEITRDNINMISYDMETGTWDMTQGYIAGQQ